MLDPLRRTTFVALTYLFGHEVGPLSPSSSWDRPMQHSQPAVAAVSVAGVKCDLAQGHRMYANHRPYLKHCSDVSPTRKSGAGGQGVSCLKATRSTPAETLPDVITILSAAQRNVLVNTLNWKSTAASQLRTGCMAWHAIGTTTNRRSFLSIRN